jgi:hypothetical protein
MQSFGGMQEDGSRTRASERRGNLAGNVSRFAHASDDEATAAIVYVLYSLCEPLIKITLYA